MRSLSSAAGNAGKTSCANPSQLLLAAKHREQDIASAGIISLPPAWRRFPRVFHRALAVSPSEPADESHDYLIQPARRSPPTACRQRFAQCTEQWAMLGSKEGLGLMRLL